MKKMLSKEFKLVQKLSTVMILIIIILAFILIPPIIYKPTKVLSSKYFENTASNEAESVNQQTNNDTKIKLLMFGDISVVPPLDDAMIKSNVNPFENVKSEFAKYDLVLGNMETNIEGKIVGSKQEKSYNFSAPDIFADKIAESGIDLVTLANNHMKDYGANGVLNTIYRMNKAGVQTFGAGADDASAFKPTIVNVKGTRIAFLAFNSAEYALNKSGPNYAGTAWFHNGMINDAIKNAKKNSDIVIVWAHWGTEQTQNIDDWQNTWGKKFIDYGADLVVGAHPHVRQKYETYKGKYIFYSLGNFVFPGMGWSPEAVIGDLLDINIENKSITGFNMRTVKLDYYGMPTIQ